MNSLGSDLIEASVGLAGTVRSTALACKCFEPHANIFLGKKRKVHGHALQTTASLQANTDSLGPDRVEEQSTCSKHIAERLCKLEQVFERFVCRKGSVIGTSTALPWSPTLTSLWSSAKDSKISVKEVSSDTPSTSSLGGGIVRSFTPGMFLSLRFAAWRANLVFRAFHPYASR